MEHFTTMSHPTFRTKCMDIEHAGRFARCLGANPRFTAIEIRESRRAKGEVRWFVCFLPSNPVRQTAILGRQQDIQEQRFSERDYTVVRDPDHDYLHVLSHHSGDTHEVSVEAATCTCGHFHYRLAGTGLLCSHLLAAAAAIRRGEVGEFTPIPARDA